MINTHFRKTLKQICDEGYETIEGYGRWQVEATTNAYKLEQVYHYDAIYDFCLENIEAILDSIDSPDWVIKWLEETHDVTVNQERR